MRNMSNLIFEVILYKRDMLPLIIAAILSIFNLCLFLDIYPWYVSITLAVGATTIIGLAWFMAHCMLYTLLAEPNRESKPDKTPPVFKRHHTTDQNRTDCGKIVQITFIANEDDDIKSRVTTTTGTFLLQGYTPKDLEGDIASIRDDKFYIGLFSQNNSFKIVKP